MKDKFHQDCTQVVASHVLTPKLAEKRQESMAKTRQIGYKTKEKMSFKAKTQEETLPFRSYQKKQIGGEAQQSPKISISYFNTDETLGMGLGESLVTSDWGVGDEF